MGVDSRMPILVVDDYQTMVRIIRALLKQIGFTNVHEAAHGGEALEMLSRNRYGLVISDWNMEPVSGFDLLRQMRANESTRDTPFILVTAESKTENVVAAKQAGVDNYIVKPFNAGTLKAKMAAVLGEF